ncbi:MAG: hypothetical protein RXS42_03320 [Nitrososphaeria archaeon]
MGALCLPRDALTVAPHMLSSMPSLASWNSSPNVRPALMRSSADSTNPLSPLGPRSWTSLVLPERLRLRRSPGTPRTWSPCMWDISTHSSLLAYLQPRLCSAYWVPSPQSRTK